MRLLQALILIGFVSPWGGVRAQTPEVSSDWLQVDVVHFVDAPVGEQGGELVLGQGTPILQITGPNVEREILRAVILLRTPFDHVAAGPTTLRLEGGYTPNGAWLRKAGQAARVIAANLAAEPALPHSSGQLARTTAFWVRVPR